MNAVDRCTNNVREYHFDQIRHRSINQCSNKHEVIRLITQTKRFSFTLVPLQNKVTTTILYDFILTKAFKCFHKETAGAGDRGFNTKRFEL